MRKIGLTGGIGSGKTTVAKVLASLGAPVFYADQEARKLMETSPEIISSIKSCFGENAYSNGTLNRKFLSDIVFNDPIKLKKLNSIVHPAVHRQFEIWSAGYIEAPYVIEEAALLFESGGWKQLDLIVLVVAPLIHRIERVMQRDGVAEGDVRSRIDSQMSDEEKIPLAHFLFFNDDQNMLLAQVLAFHEKMISLNIK